MLKSVLVKLPFDKNFKISFFSSTEKSDFSSFKDAFFQTIETDCLLSKMIKDENKSVSFKSYDDTFKCNVEITNFTSIDNGCVIEAYIVSNLALESSLTFSDSLNSSAPDFILPNRVDDSLSPNQNVQEQSTYSLPLFTFSEESSDVTQVSYPVPMIPPTGSSSPTSSCEQSQEEENLPSFTHKTSINKVPYPCPVPVFSPTIRKALAEGKILQKYNMFIRECAASLLNMVENPNKTDYENFARSVAEKYTFVNDRFIVGVSPYASFKRMISNSIRNARYYNKKCQKRKGCKSPVHVPEIIVDEVDNELHIKEMVVELKKKKKNNFHLSKLLEATYEHRRALILSSTSIQEVQHKYPALKLAEWIIFDFDKITKTMKDFRKNLFLKEIERISKNENSNHFENSLEVFQFIEKQISPKDATSCILILKVGDKPVTSCGDLQSLHAVIYLDENEKIVSSYILSQNHIVTKMEEEDIDFFEIIDLLLACYYTFDYEYPKAYSSILYFLQYILLKQPVLKKNCSSKLFKFLKLSMIL